MDLTWYRIVIFTSLCLPFRQFSGKIYHLILIYTTDKHKNTCCAINMTVVLAVRTKVSMTYKCGYRKILTLCTIKIIVSLTYLL